MTLRDNDRPERASMNVSRRRVLLTGFAGAAVAVCHVGLPGAAAWAQETLRTGSKVTVGVTGQGARGYFGPHNFGDEAVAMCNQNLVFEGLTQFENDGSTSLCLAESFEPVDGDTSHWEIRLKPGVTFHNGNPMEAADVIHSIRLITTEGTVSRGYIGPVDDISEIDALTLRVKLAAPRNWFPKAMAGSYSGIVPRDYDSRNPVGTGAFRVASWVETESVTLRRYDGYHGTPALLDEVTLQLFADDSALLNAAEAGQIDVVNRLAPALADQYEGSDSFHLYNSPTGRCYPIHMRSDRAPLDDARLRQALRMVLDRQAVVNSGYNGYATIGHDLYSPNDPDYRDDLVRVRDVEGARNLIKEAGLEGLQIELTMNHDVETALILSENAKEIGLDVQVRQLDPATFFNDEFTERPFHGGDYYPPAPFFMTSSLLDSPTPGIPTLKWSDEEYHALWNQGNATADPEEASRITGRLQEILFQRGALIIAVFVNELGLYRSGLGGIPETDFNGTGIYRSLRYVGHLA